MTEVRLQMTVDRKQMTEGFDFRIPISALCTMLYHSDFPIPPSEFQYLFPDF
jgi:hypothetical protein